jgi:hypothetical protein
MAQFGAANAADLANMALIFYVREEMKSQTTQNKPLLQALEDNERKFSSGNLQISEPVQVAFMSDTAGFLQGYSADDSLNFSTAANSLRGVFNWKEVQASLVINWTELKIDGITITDHQKTSEHIGDGLTRLTSILKARMSDFGESYKRAKNSMLWQDGTQDSKQVPGILALITDTNTTGTTGGLSRVTYPAWRNRANLAVPYSPANGSLIQYINDELIQLMRFGGQPNKALCGSDWLSALRAELVAKGFFTQTGFAGKKATNLGIAGLHIDGLGDFEYDPTLDTLGLSKRCYILDLKAVELRPMEGESMKVLKPERPYNYLVFLHTVTDTLGLTVKQLNANAVYSLS